MKRTTTETLVSPLLVYLVAIFSATLVISNVLANQMIEIFGYSLDAGNLTFPITYIISDVLSEVYGYRWSRRSAYIASIMNILLAALITLSCVMPQPEWYDGSIFETALRGSTRIVIASIVSFALGDLVNDKVFEWIRKAQKGSEKGFLIRAIGSSLFGAITDTTAFVLIAFWGTTPVDEIIPMILITVAVKVVYEVVIFPLTTIVAKRVKASEDAYMRVKVK